MASDKSRKRVAKKYGDMPDKWDDWHVRLPDPKDQIRVIDLYHRSGSKSKSDFVRARLLGEQFKVIMVDKSAVEYYRKLSELTAQVHKIGINYNQVVRLIHLYTAEKSVKVLLQELIRQTKELTALQEKAVSLTIDYRKKCRIELFPEVFKHLRNTTLLLFHIGMNIEVESCSDVRMPEQHANRLIVTVTFDAACGETVAQPVIFQPRNVQMLH